MSNGITFDLETLSNMNKITGYVPRLDSRKPPKMSAERLSLTDDRLNEMYGPNVVNFRFHQVRLSKLKVG
jgi:hypothetical protein